MALKPTIYKFRIALSDMNNDYYDSKNLTIALHPSEKPQRMLARILAFCLNAQKDLEFTKGLSTTEEPDLWHVADDQSITHWIEIGEPEPDRIKKASRLAKQVKVYTYNTKAPVWWEKMSGKFSMLPVSVESFDYDAIDMICQHLDRGTNLSVMITGTSIFVDVNDLHVEVTVKELQSHDAP
ncbi:YaeQ family protein [Vibrio parahaemolyticus]|uniref:YaeQ family protein n=1 Tax=Vibrio TaxID=662 RepID=UPI00215C1E55|nr:MULTISPECIES: YaeQ family protein [Vibrio]ELI5389487.1 YaeQ family protein [Vibrio parahaemolyticus]ELI5391940.1 YaeQ family protein [Vibrio parahaemolyticus]MCR9776259.1 YaeQ family protein [Vibrio parahaemolyticus]MCR9844647.1 YaeQ family protein [Vibrio parahaemolyticus]MDF4892278.1 YaeQ family protein [Vibrio parahaemolyticus]